MSTSIYPTLFRSARCSLLGAAVLIGGLFGCAQSTEQTVNFDGTAPVSYTHLTLPTKA